ncbi:response regulator transcription factor [Oscillatoria sp. FACHB-1407]|uniref:response regulator transcription factor n=1 Tax=Oscillatoria sp. FACHB-1407 TaxID=2692847 RepID=UPI0018EF8DFE|nr:DNA-binding response regulator [Oscillatoria sp. FACHB-1407]
MVKKILLIEDQGYARNFFLEGLKGKGFHVFSTKNGRMGIQQAQMHLPDLILCDPMLPDIDGYSVLATLRQDPLTAGVPFIFMTAEENRTDLRKAMELGANDYLTKPCTLDELLRAITTQLEKQSVLHQWYAARSQGIDDSTVTAPVKAIANSQITSSSDPLLNEVLCFIEANYHKPITLTDVAQAVGYSPAYLTNLIGRQTGQTVQRWIINRRMAAARALLLETDQNVEHIATQVGYHHVVHFFRQFRKLHGTSPQAWRTAQSAQYKQNQKNG